MQTALSPSTLRWVFLGPLSLPQAQAVESFFMALCLVVQVPSTHLLQPSPSLTVPSTSPHRREACALTCIRWLGECTCYLGTSPL